MSRIEVKGRGMTKKLTQYNIRLDEDLFARLKQHQIDETARRNKTVNLHGLIIEAIEAAITKPADIEVEQQAVTTPSDEMLDAAEDAKRRGLICDRSA